MSRISLLMLLPVLFWLGLIFPATAQKGDLLILDDGRESIITGIITRIGFDTIDLDTDSGEATLYIEISKTFPEHRH